MNRVPLDSKVLASIGYDAATKILEVEFRARQDEYPNRRIYQYTDVLQSEYNELMAAKSRGSHFLRLIKPNHKFTRIEVKDESQKEGAPSSAKKE